MGPDILPHIDIRNINGENLKRRAGIQPFLQNRLGNTVGIFQHTLMIDRAADGRDNSLTDTRDDGLFGGSADESGDIGAYRYAGLDLELNAVLSNRIDGIASLSWIGTVDHLGVDAGLHGLNNIATGKVNRGGDLPGQIDIGSVGGDRARHSAPARRQDNGFQVVPWINPDLPWRR